VVSVYLKRVTPRLEVNASRTVQGVAFLSDAGIPVRDA
jgi:hypothetical protein